MNTRQTFLSQTQSGPYAPLRRPAMRVGISGSGFIARSIARLISGLPDFNVVSVLTRRDTALSEDHFPDGTVTNSVDALVAASDIVLECSGDAVHATEVLVRAGEAGRKLITMNCEAQVTVGTALLRRGYSITEAHGDQPGCFAELAQEARAMLFDPLVYVNLKGFLNLTPEPDEMAYWANKQGVSIRQTTAFTDGSKLQLEQVLTANGLGAGIARQGLVGGTIKDLADLDYLAEAAFESGGAISDYAVYPGGPPGVAILATSEQADSYPGFMAIAKLKTREGRAYCLLKPYHLVHLEVAKTLRQVTRDEPPLLTNGLSPTVTSAAIVKRPLPAGTLISEGMGGFDVRGEAIEIAGNADIVPITLLDGARTRHALEPGAIVRDGDVDVPDTTAAALYRESLLPISGKASVAVDAAH
ncbi:MAG: SAF domain-containing protein [Pseudomonadota bacterium]